MALDSGHNQSKNEFVCEKRFNETISEFLNKRHDKEKPLWTRKRIEEVIEFVEHYKLASTLKLHRTSKHYYYGKKYDVMQIGTNKSLILKRNSDIDPVVKIVSTDELYQILCEVHQSTGHGGRDKMIYTLKNKYVIPFSIVQEFVKMCTVCQAKKKFPKKGIVVNPIISGDFNLRGQVDLVDLQSTPDRNYKWLLHYQDHATKFSFLRPLVSKRATEVAIELLKIFLEVGCPHILQSDNGREFTAAVILELKKLWPTCKIVNGRPRHPASQGSVERSNQDIEGMLRAWLIDNDSKNWAVGCYFVQFQKNSSFHRTIKRSPYKALFGTEPKTGLHSTQIPKDLLEKLVNEEDLDQLLKQECHVNAVTPDNVPKTEILNSDEASTSTNIPIVQLKQCDVLTTSTGSLAFQTQSEINQDVITPSVLSGAESIDKEVASTSRDLIVLQLASNNQALISDATELECDDSDYDLPVVHLISDKFLNSKVGENNKNCVVCGTECAGAQSCSICENKVHAICGNTVGEEGYGLNMICNLCQREEDIKSEREHASKYLKLSAEKMKNTSLDKFKELLVDSTVLVEVPKVDRGPLDGNNIIGTVLDIKNNLYQIGTSAGIIKDWFPRNALQMATTTFTETVPPIKLSLREIASKLSVFGGQGFKKCSCETSKIQCTTSRCACKKNNVLCNSRCHKSKTCFNKK